MAKLREAFNGKLMKLDTCIAKIRNMHSEGKDGVVKDVRTFKGRLHGKVYVRG